MDFMMTLVLVALGYLRWNFLDLMVLMLEFELINALLILLCFKFLRGFVLLLPYVLGWSGSTLVSGL